MIIGNFVNSKPWTYFIDKESQPGQDIYKTRFTEPLPNMLPCILFDAVNNLRAVLDQSGYASALARRQKPAPKNTAFPFGDDPAGLDNAVFGYKVCKDCPPEITALFLSFCPYKGGNDPLWALNKLCNTQKHCTLVPFAIANASATFYSEIDHGGSISYVTSPLSTYGWNAAKREMTLMSMPPGKQADIRGSFSFSVAIDGVETVGGKATSIVLDAMSRIVESVLVATEAECRSLGFQLSE